MKRFWKGYIKIASNQLDLDFTLLGGQSFRWEKCHSGRQLMWTGVAFEAYWELSQTEDTIDYKVYPLLTAEKHETYCTEFFSDLLKKYLRVEFDLNAAINLWKSANSHFMEAVHCYPVRVLDQEPFENILSFICSQNNHIRRISTMIQCLCSKYGKKIGTFNGKEQFTFPTLAALVANQEKLDSELRDAKFGYRAKFIAKSVGSISEFGGLEWLAKLRALPYEEVRLQLLKLPGIGLKVADCICLMSLGKLQSVPVDTHIFKIVRASYMPQFSKLKAVTPKVYEEIGENLRSIYGEYAGWAQTILFCTDLRPFQTN